MRLPKPIPHPNADKLEGFVINGNRVWYSKDLLKEGNTVIYFPIECQINPEILSNINLFSDKTLNLDISQSGYFGHHGRVKAVKLRGEPSEGFIMSLEDFEKAMRIQIDSLPHDVEFDTFSDVWICRKYVPQAPRNSGIGPKPKKNINHILVDGQFAFHRDTNKLVENLHKLEPEDIITITYKMHGTSAVFANVLTKRKFSLKERIAKWFDIPVVETEYSKMYSSRTVLKHIEGKYHTEKEGYYNYDVWSKTFQSEIAPIINPGITVYGEIVGYQSYDRMIQKGYDYGQIPGFAELYIYRITYTTPNGEVYEFSWDQLKQYCQKNDLKHVPELFHGTVREYLNDYSLLNGLGRTVDDNELLYTLKQMYLEKPCAMCKNRVPAEGIVVRRESRGFEAWKLKSFAFLQHESAELDEGVINIETTESNNET